MVTTELKCEDRQIRVFISSTFRDMQQERDRLVKFIFPQLRKLCESRAVVWNEVDLRWGITETESCEGKVLPLCLAEIERCRPYFIGLLGERYGWVPESYPKNLTNEQPWLKEHLHHSVTELEIIHGVFKSPKMQDRSRFYFRDPKYLDLVPAEKKADFAAENPDYADRLARLKQRIRDEHAKGILKFAPYENYPNPEVLGDLILRDFTDIINQLYPVTDIPDPLDEEAARHEAYARSRRLAFIGRDDLLKRINNHVIAEDKPLILTGDSGCGKSALLAEWLTRWRKGHPEDLIVQHYIGSTPDSADWQGLVRRILGELKRAYSLADELPTQPEALYTALNDCLVKVAGQRRIVLVIDSLNQLTVHDIAYWLPFVFPSNVRVLVSCLVGDTLEALRYRKWPEITVPLFSRADIEHASKAYFKLFAKTPDDSMLQALEASPATANALYLRAVLDELRQFGDYKELQQRTAWYLAAQDLPSLFERILTRWHEDYGRDPAHPDLVRRSLCLLACSRFGLAEKELLDLLGKKTEQDNYVSLPRRTWLPFYLAAENSLSIRTGFFNFGNSYLRTAVRRLWLTDEQVVGQFRTRLIDYFGCIPEPTERKLDELPWLLALNEQWTCLGRLLIEIDFFVAAWNRRELDVLRYWVAVEASCTVRMIEAYQQVLRAPTANLSAGCGVADLFLKVGHWEAAEEMFAQLASEYRKGNDTESLIFCLNGLAIALRHLGKLEDSFLCLTQLETLGRDYEDDFVLQACLGNQGLLLKQMRKLHEAAAKFNDQINICHRIGALQGFVAGLVNFGNVLGNLGDSQGALEKFEEAAKVAHRYGLLVEEGKSLGNQANVWLAIGNFAKANAKYSEAAELQEQIGDHDSMFRTHLNRTSLLLRLEDYTEAEREIDKLERLLRPGEDDHLLAGLNMNKARLWLLLGRSLTEARVFARRAYDLAVLCGELKFEQQAKLLLERLNNE